MDKLRYNFTKIKMNTKMSEFLDIRMTSSGYKCAS